MVTGKIDNISNLIGDKISIMKLSHTTEIENIKNSLPKITDEHNLINLSSHCNLESLVKTLFDDSNTEETVILQKYQVYRRDRDLSLGSNTTSGGVLVAIKMEFPVSVVHHSNNNYEHLDLISNKTCDLSIVYFSLNSNSEVYTEYMSHLMENVGKTECDKFIILGDFNLFG